MATVVLGRLPYRLTREEGARIDTLERERSARGSRGQVSQSGRSDAERGMGRASGRCFGFALYPPDSHTYRPQQLWLKHSRVCAIGLTLLSLRRPGRKDTRRRKNAALLSPLA